jgi:hypothetical protein
MKRSAFRADATMMNPDFADAPSGLRLLTQWNALTPDDVARRMRHRRLAPLRAHKRAQVAR